MSIIDENMLNDHINNEPIRSIKKVRDHRNEKNPHYNKAHSPEAKAAISATQKARYDLLRAAVAQSNNQITEARVKEIVRETIADYIKNNATSVERNKPIDIRL